VRRHAQEKMEKDLEHMQELEEALEIEERWTTMSPKYQFALDALELLIVKHIFELTKMNQSQTGERIQSCG
jgi:hypothetical protein